MKFIGAIFCAVFLVLAWIISQDAKDHFNENRLDDWFRYVVVMWGCLVAALTIAFYTL